MIMLFNPLLDIPHLSAGWIILLTNRDVREISLKHGTNTLHVAFIFLFSLHVKVAGSRINTTGNNIHYGYVVSG